jgi:SRSO17 transposase
MSLLEHPKAQALLAEAELTAASVRSCGERLTRFIQRYLPLFGRKEQHQHALVVVQGRLSNLERKTSEPIAYLAGQERKPVQNFVGAGAWDDEAIMAELRRHVREELADADAVLVLDPSSFPKKGTESCGVDRQWCGRLGKLDNCQVGVFWGYASAKGRALVDRWLYLPKDWAQDLKRRQKCHVPKEVKFQEKWRIGLERLQLISAELPHGWITADDEFGRVAEFRAALRQRRERYVVDVPSNTLVREVGERSAAGGKAPFVRVDAWAAQQPASRWQKLRVRAGTKGELVVRALTALVQTKDEGGCVGAAEQVVVIRNVAGEPQTWYALSNARHEPLKTLVAVKGRRHTIEELYQDGKGEVGLGQYELRSWVGWHHHMTLAILALWYLELEKHRVGKKNTGDHAAANSGDLCPAASASGSQSNGDSQRSHEGAAA